MSYIVYCYALQNRRVSGTQAGIYISTFLEITLLPDPCPRRTAQHIQTFTCKCCNLLTAIERPACHVDCIACTAQEHGDAMAILQGSLAFFLLVRRTCIFLSDWLCLDRLSRVAFGLDFCDSGSPVDLATLKTANVYLSTRRRRPLNSTPKLRVDIFGYHRSGRLTQQWWIRTADLGSLCFVCA